MPQLRRDPIVGRWVIIESEYPKTPADFVIPEVQLSNGICPFCEGHEEMTPHELFAFRKPGTQPNSTGWQVRVFPSKYPALRIEGDLGREGNGMYDVMNGIGAHEVIIDSPEHLMTPAELDKEHVQKIILTYYERFKDLTNDKRFKYILLFKNHRGGAGATLDHSHSQLIATPIVPKRVKEELRGASDYYEYKERCVFCDIVGQEIKDKKRIIEENEHFLSFCPYASRFPFEICIIPKKHHAKFEETPQEKMLCLAEILKKTLFRLKKALNNPPYNFIFHTTPLSIPHSPKDYHWHIEIFPRLMHVAGFEWGTGFYINPISPELATNYLKEVTITE